MDGYKEWLMGLVDILPTYSKLVDKLDSRHFVWTVRNDVNRASDGINLRSRFIEEMNFPATEQFFMRPCSVLEMMVALACRIEDDIMFDPALGNRSGMWFWIMLKNLGLDGMDDDHFDNENVDVILNILLSRTYFRNGNGGLFPLKRPMRNQRNVEIWYQMCSFIEENVL